MLKSLHNLSNILGRTKQRNKKKREKCYILIFKISYMKEEKTLLCAV